MGVDGVVVAGEVPLKATEDGADVAVVPKEMEVVVEFVTQSVLAVTNSQCRINDLD